MKIEPFGATVLVDGWQLTSAVDRDREARLQASFVPEDAPEVWIYGVGLGDLARVLLERPALRRLHVAVLNQEIFDLLQPLPPGPRLAIYSPGAIDRVYVPGAVCPGDLRHADEAALPLRDKLFAVLNVPFNERVREISEKARAEQVLANEALHATDRHVSALFGTDSREAVVIAGGPTASSSFDWIADKRASMNVVSVGRALVPLLAAGIVPDVVCEIDPYPGGEDFIPAGDPRLADRAFVYLDQVRPETPRRWSGPRFWLSEGDLFLGGSIVHAATDVATRMGATVVHLVGCDFCFPGGQSHVACAPGPGYQPELQTLRTRNGAGEWVPTQESMMMYHRALEELVAARPAVRFWKHDRRGVPVRGTAWADEVRDAA